MLKWITVSINDIEILIRKELIAQGYKLRGDGDISFYDSVDDGVYPYYVEVLVEDIE